MDKITLGTRNVSIVFPGVKALSNVDFEIETGKIHAVLGANGAGKSTLMKVLAGSNPDYTGDVLYNGEVVELRKPASAKALGIQIVYQEVDMALIPSLSVAENVMFNHMVMNMGHGQRGERSAQAPEHQPRCEPSGRNAFTGAKADGSDRPRDPKLLQLFDS